MSGWTDLRAQGVHLHSAIVDNLQGLGFAAPTPIQSQALPAAKALQYKKGIKSGEKPLMFLYLCIRGLGESGLWIAIGVLAAMVLALWALLSQLLLWSDAAVLRVPQNVALAEQPGVNYAGAGESAQL